MPLDRSPGFGVYVHWPFCAAKCPYCDFNSHVRHQPVDQERFAAAFEEELATMRQRTRPARGDQSIFFGGGTPSLMKPEPWPGPRRRSAKTGPCPKAEVTLEANPSSVEAERFSGYRAAGVNRVSLGVQALNDKDLRLPRPPAQCRGSDARHSAGARDLPSAVLRPDLCAARPDAGGLGSRARTSASAMPQTICRSTS